MLSDGYQPEGAKAAPIPPRGGSVFVPQPSNPYAYPGPYSQGLTLRDYFAAAAVPDAMRAVAVQQVVLNPGEAPQDAVARIVYDVADAMLRRREVNT